MLNAAIVGLGRWGQNLVNSVQGSNRIRFVAGVLRHPANAKEFADQHGLKLYDDLAKALDDPAIDAVVLATPHSAHAEQIIAAAEAGKHVFTEKPFTLTSESAATAVRACTRNKVTLAVGYNWRFQPALQEIRAMLNDGRLGRLLHIEGNFCGPSVYWYPKSHWRQKNDEGPAGGMTGRGVHVLDAMLYLGGHIDTVHAQSHRLALDYGIDDTTSMLFHFKGGATAYLGTIIATAETWRMQVFGANGWVEVGDVEHLSTWQMKVCLLDRDNLRAKTRPRIVSFPQMSTERAELEHFAEAAKAGKPLAIADGDEVHGVALLEAILASAKSGKPVKLARRAPAKKVAAKKKTARRGTAKRPGKVSARRSGRK
jgi:predicted dehydrogenase